MNQVLAIAFCLAPAGSLPEKWQCREISDFALDKHVTRLKPREMNQHVVTCKTPRLPGNVDAKGTVVIEVFRFYAFYCSHICPSPVAGRWQTASPATTELMLELHRGVQTASISQAPVAKAKHLQRAMIKVLRNGQYKHPFYWAGFALVGNFR
jgi:hypothetical protein